MSINRLGSLLDKYQQGESTPDENERVEKWFAEHGAIETQFEQMDEQAREAWVDALFADIELRNRQSDQPLKTKKLWWKITSAAAAVMVLGLSIYFYNNYQDGNNLINNDISSGKTGATLTLANGKQIRLADVKSGALATEGGTLISKTINGELVYVINGPGGVPGPNDATNVLSTAYGQWYLVSLPDQTKIWLNAGSTLKYPSNFDGYKERIVELSGEAYFEVSHLKDAQLRRLPFIVKTKNQRIIVLGTHFNINSYGDAPEETTTLLEGSILISALDALNSKTQDTTNNSHVLKPGQKAVYRNHKYVVAKADTAVAVAWKNGNFLLNGEPLDVVMAKVARWYNVEVIFTNDAAKKLRFEGSVPRTSDISGVLRRMMLTRTVDFEIVGNKVYVK
ncbi:DUF4974 domain-containing protein [Pedobacter sp. MC2016-14]|uniref:FecR domain-containing protein n=1 Tax=Pedobacter sp. MC2016-14 TaxID=2897327 RepID=UPI001E442DE6|nr:FecR domain-containing protein [Pedobacter sp. MC2016-14]MCD0489810.1 DUF4974 domain-containing protein [Pedobacter sp. MC2016-14]